MVSLLGSRDELLRVIEGAFKADIHVRGNEITVTGSPDESGTVVRLFEELVEVLRSGGELTPDAVERSIAMLRMTSDRPAEVLSLDILSSRGRTIRPKTVNQKRYVDAIDKHTVVFGIGPAGTGKTYLAMAKAVRALQEKRVNRIILTRPAVEAGERLGFLPGTLYEKIDPYLRPLYDALHDMVDPDSIPKLMAAGTIEVAPLAYMRGRSQPVGTGVLTPDGFRSIGELEVGDLVIGSNGEPTPVLGVYPQGEQKVYRLYSQDGASVLASEDHLWTVRTRDDANRGKPWRVLKTKEMIGDLRTAHHRKWELPMLSAPVQFPERDVPLDPYALGLLLGDGRVTGSTTPAFSTNDAEPVAGPERCLPGVRARWRGTPDYALNRVRQLGDSMTIANPITHAMRELNLLGCGSYTKFVPEVYLRNTPEIRIAVLQGLLDADGGSVTQQGRTCRIQFSTISPRLRDDVVSLVQSLGGAAYWRARPLSELKPGPAKGRQVRHRHDAYVLDIRLPQGIEPFRLSRKADTYKAHGGGRPMRYVDRIEPRGTAECVCIQVAAEDSLYVTEDFLLTHNTLNDAFIILDEAQNSSAEQMKMFLTRLGFNSKIVVTGDVTQVDLPAGTVSGLKVVQEILDGIPDIHFSRLSSSDVVRHKLVSDIVDAYGRYDATRAAQELKPVQQRGKRRVSDREH
ncbi:phosphate starvation-inducible protein PhoH [Nonomuraea longispora]|uniref:PhoH-like protein n=1 Tax=Nonomuraea longispora TaxID=1848320 RepID=A0A4R4MXZ9_9ACTN|nr:phosphate starvation-inducible protein PhoH [Nonomuraea longispora]